MKIIFYIFIYLFYVLFIHFYFLIFYILDKMKIIFYIFIYFIHTFQFSIYEAKLKSYFIGYKLVPNFCSYPTPPPIHIYIYIYIYMCNNNNNNIIFSSLRNAHLTE